MKVVRKLFFAWGEDKEQMYLQDMAKQGYKLDSVGFGRYEFSEAESVDAIYQFDFKGMDATAEDEYLQFYEDAGWECITRYGGWYYFYKERKDGDDDLTIFSDNSSKRHKYKRLLLFLALTGFPLYYQTLIFLPYLYRQGDIGAFYQWFRIIIGLICLLHFYALVRIGLQYRKLAKTIKE